MGFLDNLFAQQNLTQQNLTQQKLDLQRDSNNIQRQRLYFDQQRAQQDIEMAMKRNETDIKIATINGINQLNSIALDNLLKSINQASAFYQSELAKQSIHNYDIEKIILNAQLEIEKMVVENNLKKDLFTFEKYANLFFLLIERDLGLNMLKNNQDIFEYLLQAYQQMGVSPNYEYSPTQADGLP